MNFSILPCGCASWTGCGRPGSSGAIVQNLKAVSTRKTSRMHNTLGLPLWQRNYYEHVVRNDEDLQAIRQYTANNPVQWHLDAEHPAVRGNAIMQLEGASDEA